MLGHFNFRYLCGPVVSGQHRGPVPGEGGGALQYEAFRCVCLGSEFFFPKDSLAGSLVKKNIPILKGSPSQSYSY